MRPITTPPINADPHSTHRGFPQQDRVEPKEWRGIFDDYEDSSTKAGYPYVGIWGKARPVYGKCPWCASPIGYVEEQKAFVCPNCKRQTPVSEMRILEAPNLNMAPQQRRQLAVGDPKEQKLQPNPQMTSGGKEIAESTPRAGDLSFDITQYPGQVTKDY